MEANTHTCDLSIRKCTFTIAQIVKNVGGLKIYLQCQWKKWSITCVNKKVGKAENKYTTCDNRL